MKFFEVYNAQYRDDNVMQEKDGVVLGAKPHLIDPMNLKEWWYHSIRKKHFSYGQPYCVICGRKEKKRLRGPKIINLQGV